MEEIFLEDIPNAVEMKDYLNQFIQEGNFSVIFLYEANFSNTPKLRIIMEHVLDAYSLDPKDKNRLILVSDELNNNAVEHGVSETGINKVMIVVKKISEKNIYVNIEVTDNGIGNADEMNELKNQKESIGFERHQGIRGRGLFLITEKIADNLYFKDADGGGLTVGIEKSL